MLPVMRAKCGAMRGACAITVASTFTTRNFCAASFAATSRSSMRLSISEYFASVSGKCRPMSPRPAAPSSASQIACSSTSASECPSRPRW